jgi:hypothetical protein
MCPFLQDKIRMLRQLVAQCSDVLSPDRGFGTANPRLAQTFSLAGGGSIPRRHMLAINLAGRGTALFVL